ncbi:hypothetical protein F1737_02305 [Methanoplanus sp. FWC-SCC4]|uniref:Uncharacterized protein n=1 Tax=Methanochimaera problematica TaxID=2609417 RepID=A0AA97FB11_9EURY|nr:DUF5804 family protein [Methanoplanus sp. FWC-SCC4]WOF15597.1 hypothetical protein F1737_02305 [Methanoplanus sp. FWC-SCC4]
MNLLFVQKEGVLLYKTLVSSETSRNILRFYKPKETEYGIIIENATLGSALSLVSELKWYIRRYVSEILYEISPELYCSHKFALEIYERDIKLGETWDFSKLIGIKENIISDEIWMESHSSKEDYPDFVDSNDIVFEVWCSESEKE